MRVMRCQHVDDDIQCRIDAERRVLVGCGDPPDPDQSGFAAARGAINQPGRSAQTDTILAVTCEFPWWR
jgi:hypothetical protein